MKKSPIRNIKYSWIIDSCQNDPKSISHDNCEEETFFDYPNQLGTGSFKRIELGLGMLLSIATSAFSPKATGIIIPIVDSEVNLNEPSFQAIAVDNIRCQVEESIPSGMFALSPDVNLFRHTTHYKTKISVDASYSGSWVALTIGRTLLDHLIGSKIADGLLKLINIKQPPSIAIKPIPPYISKHLISAASSSFIPSAHKILAQAKTLEYLAALIQHTGTPSTTTEFDHKAFIRIQTLHAYLMECEGKLPTLDELSIQFGRSAKQLNDDFCQQYGKPIYSFMFDYRLDQAHEAIKDTNIPIKSVSAALGYSHVSNFTIAFKRKFGYPPGTLRKKSGPTQ